MNKKTILIFYAIFLLVFLYQGSQRGAAPALAPLRIIANATSYTLPTTPIISLVNDSLEGVTVDTCRDIQVIAQGIQKTPIPEGLCRSVFVPAKSTTPLIGETIDDISIFQSSFTDISDVDLRWTYTQPDSDVTSEVSFSIGTAGWVRFFFRTVFYNPVYNLFAALIVTIPGHSLGWAIITITLIIRLALLIPQQKSLVSQRKMQVIQPKIKALQDKHKGDQATIGMKMMELYKSEGVNPLGSCLPLIIQLPILIVLYQVILNISHPSNFAHLYSADWLQAFKNTPLNTHFFGLELEKHGGVVGVVLGVMTGGLQFIQMWLAQKGTATAHNKQPIANNEGMPDMQNMQKMMIYIFPIMAGIFTYQFAAGLGVYWIIGTLFMIVQQYVANQQAEDKKMVIRDKAGNVIG